VEPGGAYELHQNYLASRPCQFRPGHSCRQAYAAWRQNPWPLAWWPAQIEETRIRYTRLNFGGVTPLHNSPQVRAKNLRSAGGYVRRAFTSRHTRSQADPAGAKICTLSGPDQVLVAACSSQRCLPGVDNANVLWRLPLKRRLTAILVWTSPECLRHINLSKVDTFETESQVSSRD